jgi:hypothetical protein
LHGGGIVGVTLEEGCNCAEIVAKEYGSPLGSVIVPVTVVEFCAAAANGSATTAQIRNKARSRVRMNPLSQSPKQ